MFRFRSLALALALTLSAPTAYAADYAFGFSPITGDAWFDTRIGDVNVFATGNLDGFVDDVVVSYGAPRVVVHELVVERHYPPDYVWTVAASAQALDRPWDEVFPVFEQHRGRGWGVIAQELGIKPGSPAFHALKGKLDRHHGKWKAKQGGGPPADRGPPADKGKDKGKAKDKGPKGKGK